MKKNPETKQSEHIPNAIWQAILHLETIVMHLLDVIYDIICILYCFIYASVKLHLENNCIACYRTMIKSIKCGYFYFDIISSAKQLKFIEQIKLSRYIIYYGAKYR